MNKVILLILLALTINSCAIFGGKKVEVINPGLPKNLTDSIKLTKHVGDYSRVEFSSLVACQSELKKRAEDFIYLNLQVNNKNAELEGIRKIENLS